MAYRGVEMMKIVINPSRGGFSLSRSAFLRLREMGCKHAIEEPDFGEFYSDGSGPREALWNSFCEDIDRSDQMLIRVVEDLGEEANGEFAQLKVVEIPDDVQWEIGEYDGAEWVAEKHRRWS
jgi:thiol-disulfide isomerase/thioredoxin